MVDHDVAVGGHVDVALDGVRARFDSQHGGALGVFRRSLMEAAVGDHNGVAGEDLFRGVEGFDDVEDRFRVVGQDAVCAGEDDLLGLRGVALHPDGDGAGLDVGNVLFGGSRCRNDCDAAVAAVGFKHHIDQFVRHAAAEVEHPADAGSTVAGGFQHLAV